jgi:type IV secretion system protein VirD4
MNAAPASSNVHPNYLAIVLIGAICFAGYLLFVYLKSHNLLPWTQTLVGSPTFLRDPYARPRDIRHRLASRPTPGRVTYARTDTRHYLETINDHSVLVIGGAGSRKTTSILAPAARVWVGPAVLVSTKPDLMAQTAPNRPHAFLFEPGATESYLPLVGWSPLDAIRDALNSHDPSPGWAEAIRTAGALVASTASAGQEDGDFWMAAAEQALAALLLAAAITPDADIPDLIAWARRSDFSAPLSILATHHAPEQAALALADLANKDERIKSRIMTSLAVAIHPYDDPRVLAAAAMRNRFRPAMLLDAEHRATTLYLLGDSVAQERLAPIFSGLLDELTRAWYRRADALMRQRGAYLVDEPVMAPEQRLLLVLDDVEDIAPMPDLDRIASTGASHGVVLLLGLQDPSRLRRRLGEHKANSVVNNCQTRVITHGMGDVTTLRIINELIGQADVQTTSLTRVAGDPQLTLATKSRDILTTAELRELDLGRAIVVNGAEPPVNAYLLDRGEFADVRPLDDDHETVGYGPTLPPERPWPFQPR